MLFLFIPKKAKVTAKCTENQHTRASLLPTAHPVTLSHPPPGFPHLPHQVSRAETESPPLPSIPTASRQTAGFTATRRAPQVHRLRPRPQRTRASPTRRARDVAPRSTRARPPSEEQRKRERTRRTQGSGLERRTSGAPPPETSSPLVLP